MKIKGLFCISSLLLFAALPSQSQPQSNSSSTAAVSSPPLEEFNIWKVPNVIEGAECYFSPNGKTLIFNGKMESDKTHMVYTVNIDGTELKRINNIGADACSYYNPNGKSLLWTSTRDNLDMVEGNYSDPQNYPQGAEIYFSDLDGGNVKRLTNNKYYDAECTYSPDGQKILFGRQIDGMMDLWIMNPDGSNQKQITFTPDWQEGGAFFMPDNKTIITRAWKKSEQTLKTKSMQLFTLNEDGSNIKQITTEEGTHWAPCPCPDGENVLYVKVLAPRNFEIFLLNLKTLEEKQLTNSPAFDGFPSISQDGKTVAFSSSRGAKPGERNLTLYLMDVSKLNLGPKK